MKKTEIIKYIKQNNGAEIPDLQHKFKISYKEAIAIVDMTSGLKSVLIIFSATKPIKA